MIEEIQRRNAQLKKLAFRDIDMAAHKRWEEAAIRNSRDYGPTVKCAVCRKDLPRDFMHEKAYEIYNKKRRKIIIQRKYYCEECKRKA